MAFCCSCKINKDGLEFAADIDAFIAAIFQLCYIVLIWSKDTGENLDTCVIDKVILHLFLFGYILNSVLQVILSKGAQYAKVDTLVRLCRVWLPLRVVTVGIMYSSLYYLLRGFGAQLWIVSISIPVIVHISAWSVVLVYTLQFPFRRQIERHAPPLDVLNVGAPRTVLMTPQTQLPPASSTLVKTSSGGDNNNNIV